MNITEMIKMIKRLKVVGMLALGPVDETLAADANPPERMTYQGYLVDGNGVALAPDVSANYDVVFLIYNVKHGGTAIWAEQQTVKVNGDADAVSSAWITEKL